MYSVIKKYLYICKITLNLSRGKSEKEQPPDGETKMSKWTTKTYVMVASVLRKHNRNPATAIFFDEFCDVFKQDSEKFDEDIFIDAVWPENEENEDIE